LDINLDFCACVAECMHVARPRENVAEYQRLKVE